MRIKNISNIIFVISGFLILFLRPGILGQLFGSAYVALTLLFLLFGVLQYLKLSNTHPRFLLVWFVCFVSYLSSTSLINRSIDIGNFIKIVIIATLPICWFLLMTKKKVYIFLKWLVKLNITLSLSAIITYFLLVIASLSFLIFEIKLDTQMDNDHYKFGFYFPFTFLYSGAAIVGDRWLPRFIGLFREPGIAQFSTLFSYYMSGLFYKKRKLLLFKIILLLGFFLSFSTAGIVGFFLCEVIRVIFFNRNSGKNLRLKKLIYFIVGILLALGFTYVLFDSSFQFSIAGKLANKSGASRVLSMLTAFDFLMLKPFIGHGFYRFSEALLFENVNLLTASAEIGLLGVVLYILPYYSIGIKLFKERLSYFFVLLNFFLLILFSQPVYFLPLSIWVLVIGAFLSENYIYFKKVLILR